MYTHVHMVHGILKEHQVHDGIDLIIGLQGFLQDLIEGLPGGYTEVAGLPNPLGKVAVDQWFRPQSITVQFLGEMKRLMHLS